MVKKIHLVVTGLLIIVGLGSFLLAKGLSPTVTLTSREHSYLNPVVDSELRKHFIINFQPLRASFLEITSRYKQDTYIYFAYLNNAAWVGVNEREMFIAASLVKVPLAMAIYDAIEKGKLDPDTVYQLEEINVNQDFATAYGFSEGASITVEKLIEIMLTKSDNTAANALYTILTRVGIQDPLSDVYTSMGWEFMDSGVENYGHIHVKILSNMFLSLYNATYVNPEHSERILGYLAASDFDEEIRSGVPDNISVAHKIGVYELEDVYSDCGIVYAPNRDYILCVASSGADQETARTFIKEVSQMAYDYVIRN